MSERRYMVGHGWIDPPVQKKSPDWLTELRRQQDEMLAILNGPDDEEADEDDSVIDDEDLPQW